MMAQTRGPPPTLEKGEGYLKTCTCSCSCANAGEAGGDGKCRSCKNGKHS